MDVFRDLPRLTWRGIEVPVAARTVSFDQEIVRHKYAYRDDELVESLGRRNWRFEYTVPFRQDITKGPYVNLFIETYPKFLRACRDRAEGELVDPVLGTFVVRCEQVSTTSDVNRRDGDDVQVVFVHSPAVEDVDQLGAPLAGLDLAVQEGKTLNTQIAPITDAQLKELRLGQYIGVTTEVGLGLNALDQLAGFGAQLTAYVDRVEATIANYENKLNKLVDTMDKLDDIVTSPQNAPIIRTTKRLIDSLARLNPLSSSGKRLVSFNVLQDVTAGALAADLGMSVQDLINTNPGLPLPLIPAGTQVVYFR